MTEQELENLSYPMFKTNWYEKLLLRECLHRDLPFLCWRLNRLLLPTCFFKAKVISSVGVGSHSTLEGYFIRNSTAVSLQFSVLNSCTLRNIWIRKLLAYKGE